MLRIRIQSGSPLSAKWIMASFSRWWVHHCILAPTRISTVVAGAALPVVHIHNVIPEKIKIH